MDTTIASIASAQHGLVTRAQLIEHGLTDRMIEVRLARGQLEVIHRGVYRIAGTPTSWHQTQLAAQLYVRDAVASHRAAAFLWGLDGPFGGHLELSAPLIRRTRPRNVVSHRSTDLVDDHVTVREGVPVTKPARTLVDLGAVVRQPILDRAIDDALAKGLINYDGMLHILAEVGKRGRRGVGPARASLAERSDGPESVLEAEFERLIRRSDLPIPKFQFEIRSENGRFVARVDAAYEDERIIIELDGASTRTGRDALDYDTARQNDIIVECGWMVLRFTWAQVVGRPEYVINTIAKTLERRRNELCLPNHR